MANLSDDSRAKILGENPVLAGPAGVLALDARVVLGQGS